MEEDKVSPRLTATVQKKLADQIQILCMRDEWTSLSSFVAHLIRLGLNSYCEGSNKVYVNLKIGKEANENSNSN